MITQYDEFPVHQSPYTFATVPSTDFSWDDGYFFGLFCPEEDVFLFTGMRVSPNSNMIGGYAGVCIAGRQLTARFSRIWRENCDTCIAPLHYRFVKPFRDIHLALGENDSGLSFDLHWLGLSPAYEEPHHRAVNHGRRTTDQTRYTQVGTGSGYIQFRGKRYDVTPDGWGGTRDHSWGIYSNRKPLSDPSEWLPPKEDFGAKRALRLWLPFRTNEYTGFYHFHEDEEGRQAKLNDVFGTPFDGCINYGWEGDPLKLVAGRHDIELIPGTRSVKKARIWLEDEKKGQWQHEIETVGKPWLPMTLGYHPGSWRDGGTMATYHGPKNPEMEWDEFDFSDPPFDFQPYGGGMIKGLSAHEHLVMLTSTDPEGRALKGCGHMEFFIEGRYKPFGLEDNEVSRL